MLVRYRGGEGMLAWAFHRISGVAIWLFLVLHVIDIFLVGYAPGAYDTLLVIYATPAGIVMEWLLGAAVLYHALNGLRIIIIDGWPRLTRYHRQLWYLNWIAFALVGIPVTWVIFGQLARAMGWWPR
jgi:succinate dehydrogenase / fumarate reductase cytochrome b subunit